MFSHMVGFPFFLKLNNIPLHVYNTFFINSFVDGHHILGIVNNAVKNINIQISLQDIQS